MARDKRRRVSTAEFPVRLQDGTSILPILQAGLTTPPITTRWEPLTDGVDELVFADGDLIWVLVDI